MPYTHAHTHTCTHILTYEPEAITEKKLSHTCVLW